MFIKSTAIKLLYVLFLLQHFDANAQTITVTGTMGLGAANKISDASAVNMNGGTLHTGSGAGFSETVGTLTLTSNSTIALGTGSHTLNFAASNGTSWTAGRVLTVTGWQGSYNGTTGTSGKIFTGSSAELSAAKLAQIRFTNPGNGSTFSATQLSTGEIVATSVVVPVEFISFNAKPKNNVVELNWQTATETNNDYFAIERSIDGVNWISIDTVKGVGTTNAISNYTYTDEAPLFGLSYYRLKQVDFDQKFSYSTIAVVNFEGIKIVDLFPNPSEGSFNLAIKSSLEATIDLTVYNAIGQIVTTKQIQVLKGANTIHTQFEGATGKYLVTVKSSDGQYYDYTVIMNK